MKKFEILDHTADVGIAAYGHSMEEVFCNAAYGMLSVITDLEGVKETTHRRIETEAPTSDELLVAWLNELIYLFDAERFIFSRFEISHLASDHLEATAYGEPIDHARHRLKTEVKAATYHLLELKEIPGGLIRSQVILDI